MKNKSDLKNKLIIVTRAEPDNILFKQQLEKYEASVYLFPTITIDKAQTLAHLLQSIVVTDWIIFTSINGVNFFITSIKDLKLDPEILKKKKIAVVGPKTAQRVKQYNLSVDFIPTQFTTEQLAKELTHIKNLKILLARSDIGSKMLVRDLEKKGALVTDIPMYTTVFTQKRDPVFENLVSTDKISYITFTSPSTMHGFLERVKGSEIIEKLLTIPVISIGPVTTKSAYKAGFKNITTADIYTVDGMIKKLLEIV